MTLPDRPPAAANHAASLTDRRRLASIDALRGFAICWVVLYHVWTDLRYPNIYPVQGDAFRAVGERLRDGDLLGVITGAGNAFLRVGYLGVPLFMMLSGLSLTLSAARPGDAARAWPGSLARRLRRVLVPYWFGFAATVLFALALAFVQWQRHGGGYGHYIRSGDIPLDAGTLFAGALIVPRALREDWQFAPEGSLWFVLLIVQYYLLFPLLLRVLKRIGPLLFVACGSAATWAALALMVIASGNLAEHRTSVEMAAPFRLFEFAAGMSLGWLIAGRAELPRWLDGMRAPLAASGVAVFIAACMIDVDGRWAGTLQSPAIVVAFVLMFGPTLVGRHAVAPRLAGRPLAAIGVVSYTVLIISEPLRSITHTMSAERAPDAVIVAWVFAGMLPITLLLARPLAIRLGLVERTSAPLTVTDLLRPEDGVPASASSSAHGTRT